MDTNDEDTPKVDDSPRDRKSTNRGRTPRVHSSTGFASLAKSYRDVAPYLGLGIQLAATIVICFFLGRWLDQVLNTAPWLMIIGAFVGAGGGLYSFLKTVIELGRKEKEKRRLEKKSQR